MLPRHWLPFPARFFASRMVLVSVLCAATMNRAVAQYATLDQVLDPSNPQSLAHFGRSVDSDGARIVVGSGSRESNGPLGSVQVYHLLAGAWALEDVLAPPELVGGDDYGSCQVDGSTISVAATQHDSAGANVGAVWIYVHDGTSWGLQQKLVPSAPIVEMAFGHHALQGDDLVVGAYQARRAIHFHRTGATWTEQQILLPAIPADAETYGSSIAIDGDRLAIGAFAAANTANLPAGAVYLYSRSGPGAPWTFDLRLTRTDANVDARFGLALALRGTRLVVGAPGFGTAPLPSGATFVYRREATGWIEESRLTPTWLPVNAKYGSSVDLDGDFVVAGQPYVSAIAIFQKLAGQWTQRQILRHSQNPGFGSLGASVALVGNLLIAGAPDEGIFPTLQAGRAATHRFGPEIDALCFGDGTGTACPCANNSPVGLASGCVRTIPSSQAGARLVVTAGYPSVANDTVVLSAETAGSSTCLFFQARAVTNFGLGVIHGDGLLCLTGNVRRLGTRATDSLLTAEYPGVGGSNPISVVGAIAPGDIAYYQVWMRDASPSFCTPATWNFTNALRIAWQP